MGWAAAVEIVVAMVIGPNSVSRRSENLPRQNVEAKPQNHIQVACADLLKRLRRKAMNKFLADRLDFQIFNPGEPQGAVHSIQRMMGWLHPLFETKIRIVKSALSKRWRQQSMSKRTRPRSRLWLGTGICSPFAKNQQVDRGEVTVLNVLNNLG